MSPQRTWTDEQLARLLQISTRTLRRLIQTGQVPRPLRFGRAVRWNDKTVAQLLDAGGDAKAVR
jgi:excisionase family DNA binding protein